MVEDMRAYGAPEDEIERWQDAFQTGHSDAVELPLDCARVMEMFFAVETQWRTAIAGSRVVWLGLDYQAVGVALHYLRLRPSPEEFALLQVMEREVTAAMAEQ